MFWLDGGGSRAWSGRRSILGHLRDRDVSLTYDAHAREVCRPPHGPGEGAGRRPGAGRRAPPGHLGAEDGPRTYGAQAREVCRHQHGRVEVVGDAVFTFLSGELARAAGDRRVSWVGYLGYAARPDLPAA